MFRGQVGTKIYIILLVSFLLLGALFRGVTVVAQTSVPDAGNQPSAAHVTIESRVAASSDDAEEVDITGTMALNNVTLDNVDLELVRDGSIEQVVGIRFDEVAIPQGSTIISAYVQFTVDETDGQPVTVTIQAEAVDHSLTFSSTFQNISSRPRTASAVSWSPVPWFTIRAAGPDQQTPNLAAIIEEVTDRPDWASGNALSLIFTAGSGLSRRTAIAYDQDPDVAPLLIVVYGLPGQQRPLVDAGADQHIILPGAATLTGSVTDDGLPDPPGAVTTEWIRLSGPGDVTFANASATSTTASFTAPGVYVLRLRAHDGELAGIDDVTITVALPDSVQIHLPKVVVE